MKSGFSGALTGFWGECPLTARGRGKEGFVLRNQTLIDCHTHTGYSFDADSSMREMCETARKAGIAVYTITDHCEAERALTLRHLGMNLEEVTEKSLEEICTLREEYRGTGFQLLRGVEIGQPTQCLAVANRVADRDYDFVIGSLHALRGEEDFYYMEDKVLSKTEMDRVLERYLTESLEIIQWGRLDTLAHVGYPLRYLNGGKYRDFGSNDELVEQVFLKLIDCGKALEINTSRLLETGDTLPFPKYLKLYRQLGGELVTIGSDAHTPDKVGSGIKEGMQLLAEAGFRWVFYYQEHKPVAVELAK